jgi:hypothetical protein
MGEDQVLSDVNLLDKASLNGIPIIQPRVPDDGSVEGPDICAPENCVSFYIYLSAECQNVEVEAVCRLI